MKKKKKNCLSPLHGSDSEVDNYVDGVVGINDQFLPLLVTKEGQLGFFSVRWLAWEKDLDSDLGCWLQPSQHNKTIS